MEQLDEPSGGILMSSIASGAHHQLEARLVALPLTICSQKASREAGRNSASRTAPIVPSRVQGKQKIRRAAARYACDVLLFSSTQLTPTVSAIGYLVRSSGR